MTNKTNLLNENLERHDLRDLVDNLIFIDRHVAKTGSDSEVCVITFKTRNKGSALDLVNFLEKGFNWVLDSDISSGSDQQGKWLVFVELARERHLHARIMQIIDEVENLTDKLNWCFKYKKNSTTHELNQEALSMVPSTSLEYVQKLKMGILETVKDFFDSSTFHSIEMAQDGSVKMKQQINEWSNGTEIGFKIVKTSDRKPMVLTPSLQCRTIGSLLGGNFVVESEADKFFIYNGKTTLEVQGLYAEKI